MYQKQRNNARFHKRQNLTWFKTIFDSENSLLIVKVDLSVKHHEIRLLSLLEWMRKTPEAQQLTRHSTHQDAGDVNLHGKGDWECDIRQQLKPSMFPWLIYIHTYTHKTSFAVPCCQPPQTKKKKVVCELQDLERSDCSAEMLSALLCARGLGTECRERTHMHNEQTPGGGTLQWTTSLNFKFENKCRGWCLKDLCCW